MYVPDDSPRDVTVIVLLGLVMHPAKCISLLWVQSNLTEVSTLQTRNDSRQRHRVPNEVEG
jgi:hypothetical protein